MEIGNLEAKGLTDVSRCRGGVDCWLQDVFVYWIGWGLCFFAYYFEAESFVVAAAGLCIATFTYRQAAVSAEYGGVSYSGNTGNLASIPSLTMCYQIYDNVLHSKNTGATWDPTYAARTAESGYVYAMSEDSARKCTAGLTLMYVPHRCLGDPAIPSSTTIPARVFPQFH